ncbi:MAG: extracellular solute-binding protein [Anaerolineae bacterium]|nr:extracellular solute-binding protein [Anaerolineae bacterium]
MQAQPTATVEWWGWNPSIERAQAFIDAFNVTYPDIQVNYTFNQYNDYLNVLRLGVTSGSDPDVFGLQAGALVSEYQDFLLDLTPLLQETYGDSWRDRFYALGIDPLTSGDVTYALPWYLSAAGYLWYNQYLLDQYGLSAPTTWQEWIDVTKTFNDNGITGFVQGARDAWVNYDMYIALANEIAPGKIYQAEAGEVPWTDPDLVMAMDYWRQMFENGIMQEGALGVAQYPDARELWIQGKAAGILMGSWNTDSMEKNAYAVMQESLGFDEVYSFLPFLFPDINGDGEPGRLFGGPDVALAINTSTDVPEAAWTFLNWMTSEEAQALQGSFLNVPALVGIPLNEEAVNTDSERAALGQILSDLENSIGKREFLYLDLRTALADALQNVATGVQSPEDAMAAVEAVSQTVDRSGS